MKKASFTGFFPALIIAFLMLLPQYTAIASEEPKVLGTDEYRSEIETYDFPTSAYGYSVEYDKFILQVDSGVYIDPDLPALYAEIIDMIEEETGLSFNPKTTPLHEELTKPVIRISSRYDTGYGVFIESADTTGVNFFEEEAVPGLCTNDFYNTIFHELLHTIQMRNYGVLGEILCEGYAESYAGTLEAKFAKKHNFLLQRPERLNEIACITAYGINECGLDVDYDVDWVTKDNITEYFFLHPRHDGHEPSYWIVEYIREKYGDAKLAELLTAEGKKYTSLDHEELNCGWGLPNDIELSLIKKYLSKNFVSDFYKWFKTQDMTDFSMICDYSYSDKYTGVFNSINSYGNTPMYVYLGTGFTFTDYIRFDYTEAYAYSQKLLNIPVKGISGSFLGIGRVSFYDEYERLLYEFENTDASMCTDVAVPYATSFTIEAGTPGIEDTFFISLNDPSAPGRYDDITLPLADIAKTDVSTAPVTKKVTTFNGLKAALEAAKNAGGKITVTGNITVNEPVTVYEGTELIVKSKKKLTLNSSVTVKGKLSAPKNGIKFGQNTLSASKSSLKISTGYVCLDNGTMKLGNTVYSASIGSSGNKKAVGFPTPFLFGNGYCIGGYASSLTISSSVKKLDKLPFIFEPDEYSTVILKNPKTGKTTAKKEIASKYDCTASSGAEIAKALNGSLKFEGHLTIAKSSTINDYLSVGDNVSVTVAPGAVLKISWCCLNVHGSLSGDSNFLKTDGGGIILYDNSTFKEGDITFKLSATNAGEFTDCILQNENGKYYLWSCSNGRLDITMPKTLKISKIADFSYLEDGAVVYVNGKRVK